MQTQSTGKSSAEVDPGQSTRGDDYLSEKEKKRIELEEKLLELEFRRLNLDQRRLELDFRKANLNYHESVARCNRKFNKSTCVIRGRGRSPHSSSDSSLDEECSLEVVDSKLKSEISNILTKGGEERSEPRLDDFFMPLLARKPSSANSSQTSQNSPIPIVERSSNNVPPWAKKRNRKNKNRGTNKFAAERKNHNNNNNRQHSHSPHRSPYKSNNIPTSEVPLTRSKSEQHSKKSKKNSKVSPEARDSEKYFKRKGKNSKSSSLLDALSKYKGGNASSLSGDSISDSLHSAHSAATERRAGNTSSGNSSYCKQSLLEQLEEEMEQMPSDRYPPPISRTDLGRSISLPLPNQSKNSAPKKRSKSDKKKKKKNSGGSKSTSYARRSSETSLELNRIGRRRNSSHKRRSSATLPRSLSPKALLMESKLISDEDLRELTSTGTELERLILDIHSKSAPAVVTINTDAVHQDVTGNKESAQKISASDSFDEDTALENHINEHPFSSFDAALLAAIDAEKKND